MTEKQKNEILRLARQLDGGQYRFIDQAHHLLPVGKSSIRNGLSVSDASLCIDDLKAQIAAKEAAEAAAEQAPAVEPTPAPEGGPTAEQMIAMLGQKITVTSTSKSGETFTFSGTCERIQPSDLDGTPALAILETSGHTRHARTHRIASWIIH